MVNSQIHSRIGMVRTDHELEAIRQRRMQDVNHPDVQGKHAIIRIRIKREHKKMLKIVLIC
ncbi:hypothetical protein Bca4012_004303 [Brassica carinata]